jgi:hypothetical protein
MEFYYFGGRIGDSQVSDVEDHHFSGILFTYDIEQGDFFTQVARDIDLNKKIKYMIAIRPYAISPQYLMMISQSIYKIMPNRLEINLISGSLKEHEKASGGIVGPVNDLSSNVDRSNYLIEYVKVLDEMKKNNENSFHLDYYVSTSNKYVFDIAKQTKSKMIIQYKDYIKKHWTEYIGYQTANQIDKKGSDFDLSGQDVIVSVAPVLRKTKKEIDELPKVLHTTDTVYFSYSEFEEFIDELEKDNINKLMLIAWPPEEVKHFMDFVKYYKERIIL